MPAETPGIGLIRSVEITPVAGGSKMDIDGHGLTATADQWGRVDYTMSEALHVQGVHAQWKGTFLGDYAWIAVTHPTVGNPAVQADAAQADVDMGAYSAVFDPANGAKYMEFWSADDVTLLEVRRIASISGTVLTLDSNLQLTHATDVNVRARYDGFSPVRGTHGLDGGFRLLNSGEMLLRNEIGITNAIPAGLNLSLRVRTAADVGERSVAISYIFRKPEA